MIESAKEYKEGRAAFYAGAHKNPYTTDMFKAFCWTAGWDDEQNRHGA